jgi:hypothetical protein
MNMRTSIERLQKLWQREVWQLQERQRISKEKQRELITQNKHLQAAMLDQHPPGHDHQAERLKFMNEIHDLQTRLDKNRQWDAFMQSFSEGSLLNTRKVDKLLLSIETELESIAHDSGCLFSPDLCPVEIGHDLCSLAQDPSETHINVNGSVARLESFLIKFGHPLALRWLTMAALQRWVFLTDFPNFLPEDTQLLHAYRRVIEKHRKYQ